MVEHQIPDHVHIAWVYPNETRVRHFTGPPAQAYHLLDRMLACGYTGWVELEYVGGETRVRA